MVLSGPPPGSGQPQAPQMSNPPGLPPPGAMRGPPPGSGYMPQVRHGQPGMPTGFARPGFMGPMRYGFTPHGYGRRGDQGRRVDCTIAEIFSKIKKITKKNWIKRWIEE